MTAKETAKNIINTLPDDADFEDIMHALYISSKFEHGANQIREGMGISHNEAVKKLKSLQKQVL